MSQTIDILDPFITTATVLEWQDSNRASAEALKAEVTRAIAGLDGQNDHRHTWARPQLQKLAEAIRKELERVGALAPAVEEAREAYRLACERINASALAISEATDVDALLRARAQNELDRRGARAARIAFDEIAKRSIVRPFVGHELYRGWLLLTDKSDTALIAGYAPALLGYSHGERNSDDAFTAFDACDACRNTSPAQMVWEIAEEAKFPRAELAFRVRWESFARVHRLPFDEVEFEAPKAAE
jgi:hypothetical protein